MSVTSVKNSFWVTRIGRGTFVIQIEIEQSAEPTAKATVCEVDLSADFRALAISELGL